MTRPQPFTRRHALRGAAVAGVGVPLLGACGGSDAADGGGDTGSTSGGSGAKTPAGGALASASDIPEGGGVIFESEGVVLTQPTAGEFKAFDNICTHQGCPVSEVTETINCDCHGSKYSIADGSVVNGPATESLAAKEITVDGDSISLA